MYLVKKLVNQFAIYQNNRYQRIPLSRIVMVSSMTSMMLLGLLISESPSLFLQSQQAEAAAHGLELQRDSAEKPSEIRLNATRTEI